MIAYGSLGVALIVLGILGYVTPYIMLLGFILVVLCEWVFQNNIKTISSSIQLLAAIEYARTAKVPEE